MGDNQRYVIDEDDDDDDDDDNNDVYMYPTDMHPDEQDAYRAVVQASKAIEWDQQQDETFMGSKHKTGELSHLSDAPRPMRKSQSVRHSKPLSPIALSLYKYFTTRRRNIKDLFKCGSIKETMGRLISKFFIYEGVAPYKANSHHFKNMIIGTQQAGNY